jgi:hypothetical protein
MSRAWRIAEIVALLMNVVPVVSGSVAIIDPALLPEWLPIFYSSVVATGFLIVRRIFVLLTNAVQDPRSAFGSFFVLYLTLIVGFASLYYLIREDFVPKENPQAIEEYLGVEDVRAKIEALRKQIPLLRKQVPEVADRAQREYEEWRRLESEKRALYSLMAQPEELRRARGPRSMIPPPEVVYKEVDALEIRQKALDSNLLARHRDYLAARAQVERTEMEIEGHESSIRRYSYLNFVYFSTVTVATVGYGDIVPKRIRAKMFVTGQILLGGALVLIYLTLALRYWRKGDKCSY